MNEWSETSEPDDMAQQLIELTSQLAAANERAEKAEADIVVLQHARRKDEHERKHQEGLAINYRQLRDKYKQKLDAANARNAVLVSDARELAKALLNARFWARHNSACICSGDSKKEFDILREGTRRYTGLIEEEATRILNEHGKKYLNGEIVQAPAADPYAALTLSDEFEERYKNHWRDKDEFYWMSRLREEIDELYDALHGVHKDTPEWELSQIRAIAGNWLKMRYEKEHKV